MTKKKRFGISKSLTESLSQTVQVANMNAGQLRYEIVPISRIELDPNNPRELALSKEEAQLGISAHDPKYDDKKKEIITLDSLRHSITEKGVLNPVWIFKSGSNYTLVMGERRILASLLAGKSEIPAKILDSRPLETDLRILQWIENIERSDLSLWERISNLTMIVSAQKAEDPSLKVNATYLKNILGCSLPHAMNYLAVMNSNIKLQDAIQDMKINNLEKAALLANIENNDLFNIMFDKCINGASFREMQNNIREYKQNALEENVNIKKKHNNVASKINLGHTLSSSVVKNIINALRDHQSYQDKVGVFDGIDWDSTEATSKAFQKFIKSLENE